MDVFTMMYSRDLQRQPKLMDINTAMVTVMDMATAMVTAIMAENMAMEDEIRKKTKVKKSVEENQSQICRRGSHGQKL